MANKRNSTIRQRTHNRVDKIIDKAESMNENSREAIARLKNKAIVMRENVDGRIERNPEKSVLIAAGIGAVLGSILTAVMLRKR